MFPFRSIKCLRAHENLSHSAIHLSIAEPIQDFNFGLGGTKSTAHTFTECNHSSLRRNEQRRGEISARRIILLCGVGGVSTQNLE